MMGQENTQKKLEIMVADEECMKYIPRFKKAFDGMVNFTPVSNGGMALRLVQQNHYDAVILSYGMTPGGYQTAFKIRSSVDGVKIIGFSKEWNADLAVELGLYHFSDVEGNIALAIAGLLGMDKQTYERKVKPNFDNAEGQ